MSKPGNTQNTEGASHSPCRSSTRDSTSAPARGSIRRQRQRLAECLRLIAGLRARIEELQAENAELQDVVAAQAERIAALRQDAAGGNKGPK